MRSAIIWKIYAAQIPFVFSYKNEKNNHHKNNPNNATHKTIPSNQVQKIAIWYNENNTQENKYANIFEKLLMILNINHLKKNSSIRAFQNII